MLNEWRFEILLQSCDCGFSDLVGHLVGLLSFFVNLQLGDPGGWPSWSLLLGYLRVYLHWWGDCSVQLLWSRCFLPRGGGFLLVVNLTILASGFCGRPVFSEIRSWIILREASD